MSQPFRNPIWFNDQELELRMRGKSKDHKISVEDQAGSEMVAKPLPEKSSQTIVTGASIKSWQDGPTSERNDAFQHQSA